MSAELVGPLRRVWFNEGYRPRYYDLPRNTLDLRYTACADHHPACDCREASIAEEFDERLAEFTEIYNAVLDAIKGHQTYAWKDGERDKFAECKCPACGIARKAHVGYWQCKDQRDEADNRMRREHWLRLNRATLAPVHPYLGPVAYPYSDIEVPF